MAENNEPETVEAEQGIAQPNPYKTGRRVQQEDYRDEEER